MTLVLNLPPDAEAKLRDRARETGKAPETIALEAICEGLASDSAAAPVLPMDAWIARFDAWIGSQKPRNPNFDDSRESIYPDRS